jgi:hypothetical protein
MGTLHVQQGIHHPYRVLRQVYNLFEDSFSTECYLEPPISIYSILSFLYYHPLTAYVFILVFPSLILSFLQ